MSEWRTMDSAPTVLTEVILYDKNAGTHRDGTPRTVFVGYYDENNRCWRHTFNDDIMDPSRWMPLPEPPK